VVSIERCPDYSVKSVEQALIRTFDNLGGIERFVKPGMKVVLKPNLVLKKCPEEAATTHPVLVQVLSGMIQQIAGRKAGGKVIIADSPGGAYSERRLKAIYAVCGMDKAARASGAELNLDTSEVEIDNTDGRYLKKVTVIKPFVDADLVINLPKMKSHGQMVYTGAVKNMFGAIPGVLKAEYHFRMPEYREFANAIIDIFLSVRPALNIMDAVIGMDGHGPTAGSPRPIGMILAGENAFELDHAALNMLDFNADYVPVLKEAVIRGLCPANFKDIELRGSGAGEKIRDFRFPQTDALRAVEFYANSPLRFVAGCLKPKPVFNHRLCTGCSECRKSCPAGVIEIKEGKPEVNLAGCIRCFCCQELCPAGAVAIKRTLLSDLLIRICKKI
jgi:uncharacterized protein (DUF362 family)/Pyruvate/2-oxoacid:ferredoxin oxidoreductase delta subunit